MLKNWMGIFFYIGRASGQVWVVSHASGSCHLRLANTYILVRVKTELETPDPAAKDRGRVEFFVNCQRQRHAQFRGAGRRESGHLHLGRAVPSLQECYFVHCMY